MSERDTDIYHLRDLSFAYAGREALRIDELRIAAPGVTAIAGPNGGGKSTLFDILALLRPAADGEMLFRGRAVTARNRAALRRQIGYVQQKPYLLNMSARENIGLGLRFRGVAAAKAAAAVENIARELRLQPLLDRAATRVSGGEAQKIALARALAPEPAVVIMDEPFTYLDEQTATEIQEWIRAQQADGRRAIVFSAHDRLRAQESADRVLSLIDGRVYTTPPGNLFTGAVEDGGRRFVSGKARFALPRPVADGRALLIDPRHLAVSREPPPADMPNRFHGVIMAMNAVNGEAHIKVQAEAVFHVALAPESAAAMALQPGQQVWVSCEARRLRVV